MDELDYELYLDRLTIDQIFEAVEMGAISEEEADEYYDRAG